MTHGEEMPTKLVSVRKGEGEKTMVEIPDPLARMNGVSSKSLPDIKNWAVGGTYLISIRVKQSSTRTADRWEIEQGDADIGEIIADFDVIAIQAAPADQQPGVAPVLPAPKV